MCNESECLYINKRLLCTVHDGVSSLGVSGNSHMNICIRLDAKVSPIYFLVITYAPENNKILWIFLTIIEDSIPWSVVYASQYAHCFVRTE